MQVKTRGRGKERLPAPAGLKKKAAHAGIFRGTADTHECTASDFARTDLIDEQGGARTGWGGEADVGLDSKVGSVYLGYSWGRHDAEARGRDRAINDWTVSRGVIGGRLHILGSSTIPVVPNLGAGGTIGNATYTARVLDDGVNFVDRKVTSENSVGWFLEGGAIMRAQGPLSIIGSLLYHNFNAGFEPVLDVDRVKVSFVKFNLGLRYAFGDVNKGDDDDDDDDIIIDFEDGLDND